MHKKIESAPCAGRKIFAADTQKKLTNGEICESVCGKNLPQAHSADSLFDNYFDLKISVFSAFF